MVRLQGKVPGCCAGWSGGACYGLTDPSSFWPVCKPLMVVVKI